MSYLILGATSGLGRELAYILAKNSIDIIEEVEDYLLDIANNSNEGYVSEDGVVERWVGGVNKKEITKEIKKAAKIRRKHIKN